MQWYLCALTALLLATGCKKTTCECPPKTDDPKMEYTELNDKAVGFNSSYSLDLNKDGEADFSFSTLLVGDPVLRRDYRQYYIVSKFYTNCLVNGNEETPVLQKGDKIGSLPPEGFHWYNASHVVIAQKIIEENGTSWSGNWKQVAHAYQPVSILKGDKTYYGWIELSFDMQSEKIILHRAAVAKDPNVEVKAGG
ncbi:hypothetical protein [Pinibacter soli]|uniref:Lipoprotein n=1 Tax=Pinibacter soli TaxID=3044211 RepID=A0ABT6RDV8_9BACT|nr:hypothetical protein [Pinibacter soli]MDI3320710.1 hypothetical protein [Pinibacter soli]